MKRISFLMYLKPNSELEYKKRHDLIWPELLQLIKESGVYDYSISWDRNTNILFASQKVYGDSGSQDLGQNPIVKRWWAYMADLMETNPDNSPKTIILEELFYLN